MWTNNPELSKIDKKTMDNSVNAVGKSGGNWWVVVDNYSDWTKNVAKYYI